MGVFYNTKEHSVLELQRITDLLRGKTKMQCVFEVPDPWNTAAVQGIENDGSRLSAVERKQRWYRLDSIRRNERAVTVHSIGGFVGDITRTAAFIVCYSRETWWLQRLSFLDNVRGHCFFAAISGGKLLGDWRLRSSIARRTLICSRREETYSCFR